MDERRLTIPRAFQDHFRKIGELKSRNAAKSETRYLVIAEQYFIVECGLQFIDEIKISHLESLLAWIAIPRTVPVYGAKPAWAAPTRAKCLKAVKGVLRRLFMDERLERDPGQYFRVPRGTSHRRRAMTAEEFRVLFAAAPLWLKPILTFIEMTGARPSSVAMLQWQDVDLETATLTLRSRKGGAGVEKEIRIPMIDELFQLMAGLKDSGAPSRTGDFVFRDRNGYSVTAHTISVYGSRLIKACGLKGVVLYGLRHKFATDLAKSGVNLEIVRQALGHATIQQSSEYARSIDQETIRESLRLVKGGKK